MPLFKKKDSKKESKAKDGCVDGYPRQKSYPVQQQAVAFTNPPPYSEAIGQTQPQGHPAQPNVSQTVFIPGVFDAGARFDHVTPPRIPPPPPGTFMHPAQIATSMGCNVQVTQRPSDYLEGGSSGGFTLF